MDTRRSRRTFLTEIGRTSLGLVVLGSGLSACSGDDTTGAVATAAPDATGSSAIPSPAAEAGASTGTASGDTSGGTEPLVVDLGFVAAYLLMRDGEAALVDTGVADSEAAILAVLEGAGLGWSDLSTVILTHSHGDHAGSLAVVADMAPDATLHAGAPDIDAMTAPREILAVGDGDQVFGLDIIETPGHTPGHISVYDPVSRLLATGDALVGGSGQLEGPPAEFTPDMATAIQSVAKLSGFDVDRILVGHGFPASGGTAELVELAGRL